MNYRIILFTLLAIVGLLPNVNANITFTSPSDAIVTVGDCTKFGPVEQGYSSTDWPEIPNSCVRSYSETNTATTTSQYVFGTGTAYATAAFWIGTEGTNAITDVCLLETALNNGESMSAGAATKCIIRARLTDAGGATPCNVRLLSTAGATIGGTLLTYAETFPGSEGCDVHVEIDTIDWTADTFRLSYDGTQQAVGVGFAQAAATAVGIGVNIVNPLFTPPRVLSVASGFELDGVVLDITVVPEKIPGIRATVTQAWDGSDCLIDLFWKLSPNDPDQVTGDFLYEVFLQGVSLGDDTITAADSDGIRYSSVDYSGSVANGFANLYVIPKTAQFENIGLQSDAVTVDCRVLGDSDSAGTFSGGGSVSGAPASNTANPIGSLVNYFNTSWGFDGTWLFGIMTVIIVMAGFIAFGKTPIMLAIGGFLGVGTSVTLGFFPLWVLFVMIFLILAVTATMLGRRNVSGDSD